MSPTAPNPPGGHYFDSEPTAGSKPRQVEINLPDMTLSLTADSGVFSADRLDAGTKLLLLEAPPIEPHESTVLDIGCGWGPIACVAATRAPWAKVWAVDVNQRALDLTNANADRLGLADRVTACSPDDLPADIRFDRILSNPPIRIGKTALHELLISWLSRLSSSGRAHLVVQKHLGSDSLARWLTEQGHEVERVARRAGYRILEVREA